MLFVFVFVLFWAQKSVTNFDNETTPAERYPSYGFYRKLTWGQEMTGQHRLFAHGTGNLTEFPAACLLLTEHFIPSCSAAVVSTRWAVTAAHCLAMRVAFLYYNAEYPSSAHGNIVEVLQLYQHPEYKVEERHEGLDVIVASLQHDVGLVYVDKDIKLNSKLLVDPLLGMMMYKPAEMKEHELQVMGFGHTVAHASREELFSVKMRMVNCTSTHWSYCICGVPSRPSIERQVSVCMADSGGPVLYRGVQVAVTSLGPVECESPTEQPPAFATSVFTVLYPYVDLINDTIHNTSHTMHMTMLSDDSFSVRSKLTYVILGLVARCFISGLGKYDIL